MRSQRLQTGASERPIFFLHSPSDLRDVRPISVVDVRTFFCMGFDAIGRMNLVHGILRDVGAMSAQNIIHVDVHISSEIWSSNVPITVQRLPEPTLSAH